MTKLNLKPIWSTLRVVIATHVYATGPPQDLQKYLVKKNIENLLFIGHPLFFDTKLKGSGFEIHKEGKKIKEHYRPIRKLPELLTFAGSFILNLYWVFKHRNKFEIYFGVDNLNAFSGLVLRRLGLVKKVIYYPIDYNPRRFANRLLNRIYHWIDQYCVKHANETWNLSPRVATGRQDYFGFSSDNQRVVPIGIWYDRFQRLPFKKIHKKTLVFMGHVIKKQGVQYVVAAIPLIIKKIPDFEFLIIGGGNYLDTIKKMAKNLGVEKNIRYTGYVEKHEDIETMLSQSALAVALYDKYDKDNNLTFTYFADPGKLKSYLAAGLPILLTDVPFNAIEIEKAGCGRIIDRSPENIATAVISFLADEEKLRQSRQQAIAYAKQFDWPDIFEQALERHRPLV